MILLFIYLLGPNDEYRISLIDPNIPFSTSHQEWRRIFGDLLSANINQMPELHGENFNRNSKARRTVPLLTIILTPGNVYRLYIAEKPDFVSF